LKSGHANERADVSNFRQESVMAGRGPQSFKKRQKEQQRKERQQEKAQKREERKGMPKEEQELHVLSGPLRLPEFQDDLGNDLSAPVEEEALKPAP
jgi:hypothetical protein